MEVLGGGTVGCNIKYSGQRALIEKLTFEELNAVRVVTMSESGGQGGMEESIPVRAIVSAKVLKVEEQRGQCSTKMSSKVFKVSEVHRILCLYPE